MDLGDKERWNPGHEHVSHEGGYKANCFLTVIDLSFFVVMDKYIKVQWIGEV